MDDFPVFQSFQAVTLVDCPSPEPSEATVDSLSPEDTADAPPPATGLVVYRPHAFEEARLINNLRFAVAWANSMHVVEILPHVHPLVGVDYAPQPLPLLTVPPIQTPTPTLTETRNPLDAFVVPPMTGMDFCTDRLLNAWKDLLKEIPEQSSTMHVECPMLPPGGMKVARP